MTPYERECAARDAARDARVAEFFTPGFVWFLRAAGVAGGLLIIFLIEVYG